MVSRDVSRRLVARTMAQQTGSSAKTAFHQHALSPGRECIAHVLQAKCDPNPQTTVT